MHMRAHTHHLDTNRPVCIHTLAHTGVSPVPGCQRWYAAPPGTWSTCQLSKPPPNASPDTGWRGLSEKEQPIVKKNEPSFQRPIQSNVRSGGWIFLCQLTFAAKKFSRQTWPSISKNHTNREQQHVLFIQNFFTNFDLNMHVPEHSTSIETDLWNIAPLGKILAQYTYNIPQK